MPTDVTLPPGPRRYALFISYRHADNIELGRKWATWLHESVENYEVPEDLVGKINLRNEPVPATLYPVFRDEEELPADADLSSSIRLALENSSWLVVLCSPRAVQSRFVADEIRYFKELGKSSRILALMIDGEPNAADDPEKLSRLGAAMECFPEPLKFGVPDASGKVDWTKRTEPIAADCRPGGRPEQGWTTAAAYEEWLEKQPGLSKAQRAEAVREYAERLQLSKLKVIAGALGLRLGQLTQRDKARQLRKARQRARILTGLSVVFACLTAAAGVLGWIANERRKEAVAQRREADLQRQEANTQRQFAVTQQQAAETARGQAESEKRQAVATLATSDFQEGINRLSKPNTARGGLAFLARSARAGNQSAAMRIWTLFQQESFWLQDVPAGALEPSPARLSSRTPPAAFQSVVVDGKKVAPTWYVESADGTRCLTVVSTALAGEGTIAFRAWKTSGKPLGPWRKLNYKGDNYLSGIEAAALSEDGRFAAIIAAPWRDSQYVEVWNLDKGTPVGEQIPAGGAQPNYQSGAFTDVWFTPWEKGAIGPLLVTLSNRGNAAVHRLDADPESPALLPLVVNRHDQAVRVAAVDLAAKRLVSAAADQSLQVASLESGESIGWPLQLTAPAEALHVDAPDHFSVRLAGGKTAGWQLLLPTKVPPPSQQQLAFTGDPALHRQWPDNDAPPPAADAPVIADKRGSRQLRIVDGNTLVIIDVDKPEAAPVWQRRFSSAIAHARFAGDDAVVVQSGFFSTEVWDVRTDAIKQPPVDEGALFTTEQTSDTVLLSSLSPDGKLVLSRSFLWEPPNVGIYAFTAWDGASGKPLSNMRRITDNVANDQLSENHAEFSADGNFLLFGRSVQDGKPAVTSYLQLRPPAAVLPQIPDLAEALSGQRLKPDGNLEVNPAAAKPVLVKIQSAL